MTEIVEPGLLETPKKSASFKPTDILFFGIILVIIVVLGITIVSKLSIKHQVSAAQVVSDKVITAIQKRDGAAVQKLGDKQFRAKNSAADLTAQFKAIEIATLRAPQLNRKIVFNGKNGRTIFFIYKYTALKVPFYLRTGLGPDNGSWALTSITGNADESQLIVD